MPEFPDLQGVPCWDVALQKVSCIMMVDAICLPTTACSHRLAKCSVMAHAGPLLVLA